MLRRIAFWAAMIAALWAFTLIGAPQPTQKGGVVNTGERPVVVAMFHSGFCTACKILAPRLAQAREAFADRPVRFVTFDKTWTGLGADAIDAALTETPILTGVWTTYKDRGQGFALIVDQATGAVLETLTISDDAAAIRQAIATALNA